MFRLKNEVGPRGLRAAVSKARENANSRKNDISSLRPRRGASEIAAGPWRRCVIGPNRISSLGVWKRGARRLAVRANRTGDTQWLRPYRPQTGIDVLVRDDSFQNESA